MSSINKIQRFFKGPEKNVFTNDSYRKLTVNYENFFEAGRNGINLDAELIKQIQRVSFELSNICNYSVAHKKCPASRVTSKKTLSTGIIRKVLTELGEKDYSGVIAFHRYNEPLIDPRLFSLIRMSKELCRGSKILILTNGFYLTQIIADDLADLDIEILAVSAYSKSEFERLVALNVKVPYKVFYSELDDREDIYSRPPLDLKMGCLAPLRDLTINVDGKVALCCLDWQNRYEFGDVSQLTLSEIINKVDFLEVLKGLNGNTRCLDICRRCTMSR